MPEANSFRQVDEKHVSSEVELMVWSPKMDLIAIANVQGEVVLHRLSWQKVWTLAPPAEDVKVTGMAWRPDGKVICISYDCGRSHLCDIENASCLHVILTSSVSTVTWVSEVCQEDVTLGQHQKECFQDLSSHFLPKLPSFNKSYSAMGKTTSDEVGEDAKKLQGQTELNILIMGTEEGSVLMYAFGVFPVGKINLQQHGAGKSGRVISATLSEDLYLLTLLVEVQHEESERRLVLMSFDTPLLATRHQELRILALKFGQVSTYLNYLGATIQHMCEAWEDILLEMDSKLRKLAEEKYELCSGTVSNDFLRLLMFGTPSDELQHFLLYDLTEKGLKKLGHSIETSYSNIQKLVLKHLQSVGQAIMFHLSDICGMSLWYDKFGILGLSTEVIQHATNMAGAFMLKASELQQVIDGSMKNFKAFFRWLYVVIQKLSDEPIPPELSKMTQQELGFVAHFLKENFTEENEDHVTGFKLERVGQYLKDEDLSDPPDNEANLWAAFLKQNPKIADSPLMYKSFPEKSLLQMHRLLESSVEDALSKCAHRIGELLQCTSTLPLFQYPSSSNIARLGISHYSKQVSQDGPYWTYTTFMTEPTPCEQCYVIRQQTTGRRQCEMMCVRVGAISSSDGGRCGRHRFLGASFYDPSTLSVLLVEDCEDSAPVLAQVALSALEQTDPDLPRFMPVDAGPTPAVSRNIPCVDLGPHLEQMEHRRLENMRAAQFSVSGTRKVACVLFSSRRRVRLFLMDLEDEDEDDDDEGDESAVSSSLDISKGRT